MPILLRGGGLCYVGAGGEVAGSVDIPESLLRLFEQEIPFNAWLGIRVEDSSPGRIVLRLPFRPELVGDARRPALHGGVLSTLADTAGGLVVWMSTREPTTSRVSTVDLLVDYVLPARLEDLLCEAKVLRIGNRVGVATMRLYQPGHREGEGEVVPAHGRGVYSVVRAESA